MRLFTCVAALSTALVAGSAGQSAAKPNSANAATPAPIKVPNVAHPAGETPQWWYRSGASTAAANGATRGKAKNVIVFIGDGMSLTTVTAARILDGQRKGDPGEGNKLSWENFPNTAFSRTYNTDSQTPDSAGTMTAITTGVKSHMGAIGVYAGNTKNCADSLPKQALTWLELADSAGMATGIVTTARITHATPAATYAHVPNRDWESSGSLPDQAATSGCTDIAAQLISSRRFGTGPQVVMGGGRSNFLPDTKAQGKRTDGRDLVAEWRSAHPQGAYVTNTAQLRAQANVPSILGLFSTNHLDYDHDRETGPDGQPSLEEMTRTAIANLQKNPDGYVLMVEGARIDMAHHQGNAFRGLDDTIALSKAVQAAVEATSAEDTLILVTADHSHSLNFVGYPVRGNPILGKVRGRNAFDGTPGSYAKDLNGKPYTTLSYNNGPGNTGQSDKQDAGPKHYPHNPKKISPSTERPDLTAFNTEDHDYMQEALVPLSNASHGGDDAGIWARGPGAEAVRGSLEQNVIYHLIVQVTPRLRARLCQANTCNADGVPVDLPNPAMFVWD